jgi:site-specific DNA-methyltransferase (adenine-specific)
MQELPLDQILTGDCAEVLKTFPSESVDLVFADPPYNLQLKKQLHRPDQSRVDGVDESWDKFASFEEYDRFTERWLSACKRVLKPSGALWVIGTYHNIYRIGRIVQDLGFWLLNDVVWVKPNPMPNFHGARFTNAHETLIWAQKDKGARYSFNYREMKSLNDDLQMRSDWVLPVCKGRERIHLNGETVHSTQKPESLLYRIVLASSNPCDVVVDPFFGTGTTGVICQKLNRHWIGIEQDAKYSKVALERIQAEHEPSADPLVFKPMLTRRPKRIPFGALLEAGLLSPGQILYFQSDPDLTALILAGGHLLYNDRTGSIHAMATLIRGRPGNGWVCWYYRDTTGLLQPIDKLREKIIY